MQQKKSLLNCGHTDPNKILPIHYSWARAHYKTGVANNWTPEEVPMQQDVEQWKKPGFLSDDERRMILWNLGFFSTAESLTANNIVLAVYKHITNPECRQYLLRQAFEEAIHSDMFIYCCDSLGLDPDEVYTMYQTVPSIKAKDDFVVGMTQSILAPDFATHTVEDIQKLLHDLVGYYVIMEGIFFYAGFAMMLHLQRNQKMVGVGEQFQYTLRDECLTPDTELLTPHGWIPVTEMSKDTLIAQYHEDGTLSFTKPIQTSKSSVEHVYRFHNEQGHIDQQVSENHRVVYITKHGNLKVVAAKDATPNPYCKFINTGIKREGTRQQLSPYERFLVALQADGRIIHNDIRNGKLTGELMCNFHFKKERKIDRLFEIVDGAGLRYAVSDVDDREMLQVRVWVPLDLKPTKQFQEWVDFSDKTAAWCQDFIEEIAEWDGHRVVESDGARITYGSVVPENVDMVQAAASLSGYRTHRTVRVDSRKESYSDYHRLQINKDRRHTRGQKVIKERIEYNGEVFGVEVPSTFLLIRRNGAVSVTGNSVHLAFGADLINNIVLENPESWTDSFKADITQKIQMAVELEHAYAKDCLPRGILGLNADLIRQYLEYIADRRLQRIGLPILYKTNNPFDWMSEVMDLRKEKNFFETRVTEYQTAGQLDWD